MNTSNGIAEKLMKFQRECPAIVKGSENPYYSKEGRKATYADLSEIVKVTMPILHKVGLVVIQPVIDGKVVTKIMSTDTNEVLESTYPIICKDVNDPQKYGGGVTYARRYGYTAALGLVAEEDDDGNTASGVSHKKEEPKVKMATVEQVAEIQTIMRAKTATVDANGKKLAWNSYMQGIGSKATKAAELTYEEAVKLLDNFKLEA